MYSTYRLLFLDLFRGLINVLRAHRQEEPLNKQHRSLLMLRVRRVSSAVVLISLLFLSCNGQDVSPKFLFSLPLGNLPGEFKHWNRDISSKMNNILQFKKGIFYIGNGDRVLIVSSNGYLLDFIANDIMLVDQTQNLNTRAETKRQANFYGENIPFYGYPLHLVNNMAVDSKARIIMTNTTYTTDEEYAHLSENKQNRRSYLLMYNEDKHLYNILRDSEHKSFDMVINLFIKANDDIVLVNKEQQSHHIYILDRAGLTKETLLLPYGQYPKLLASSYEDRLEEDEYFALVNAIVPSINKNYIYVQFFYYMVMENSTQDAILSLPFLESRIFRINLETGEYDRSIAIPFAQDNTLFLHSVLADETLVFFNYLSYNEQESLAQDMMPQVYFVNQSGNLVKKYNLQYPEIDFYDLEFAVDEKGNIGAFFLLKDRLELYMWR